MYSLDIMSDFVLSGRHGETHQESLSRWTGTLLNRVLKIADKV